MAENDDYLREDGIRIHYVGRLDNIFAELTLNLHSDEIENDPNISIVRLHGEIILTGQFEDSRFVPSNIQRLALYGSPVEVREDVAEALRAFDLVGPREQYQFEEINENKWEIQFPARLYYSKIGDAAFRSSIEDTKEGMDAIHPPAETAVTHLVLTFEAANSEHTQINFETIQFTVEEPHSDGGLIHSIDVDLGLIELFSPVDPRPPENKPANSLTASCDQTNPEFQMLPPCDSDNRTCQREIGLTFINLSSKDENVIELWCQHQLDQVCRIWCRKGALDLDVIGEIIGSDSISHKRTSYQDVHVESLGKIQAYKNPDFIRVFIVNQLATSIGRGRGITLSAGLSEAYIVLDVRMIDPNEGRFDENILAHELCHVIGLNHSFESETDHSLPGSENSITEPSNHGIPPENTRHNFNIFTANQLNAKVRHKVDGNQQPIWSCFDPDW